MKIAVVGTGYVGLVTGTCFAETGNKVTCIDIDKSKVDKLVKGVPVAPQAARQCYERGRLGCVWVHADASALARFVA